MSVIVSCTTTSARAHLLYYTILSLVHQSRRPDRILINISDHPYLLDEGMRELPWSIDSARISVNWVENTGPYRKLLPALDFAHPGDVVVTIDDDVVVSSSWLATLMGLADEWPDHIVTARAREIRVGRYDGWARYVQWPNVTDAMAGKSLLPLNGAGTVFRASLLDLDFLHDRTFDQLAPTNDDMWFRLASMRQGTPVRVQPAIDRQSGYIKHGHGMWENFNGAGSPGLQSPFSRLVRSAWRRVQFGANSPPETTNDKAWKAAYEYCVNRPGFDRDCLLP